MPFLLAGALLAGWAIGGQPASAAALDDAQRAYMSGQFAEARQLWERRAEAGDLDAQLSLGLMLDMGKGTAPDPAAAYQWYRRAAEAGLPQAQFNVGVMHDSGDGVPRDAASAALWYGRAAAHGERRAQFNLAQLYDTGHGVPRNLDQAEVWYAAAAASLPAAADKLAALRRGRRAGASTRNEDGLTQPQPAAPLDGSNVGRPAGAATVELVWSAPVQPVKGRFFVQLLSLDDTGPREAFATYLDESAVLAPLERVPGRYAWRVYAVSRDLTRYAASPWTRFSVQASGTAEQSVSLPTPR